MVAAQVLSDAEEFETAREESVREICGHAHQLSDLEWGFNFRFGRFFPFLYVEEEDDILHERINFG